MSINRSRIIPTSGRRSICAPSRSKTTIELLEPRLFLSVVTTAATPASTGSVGGIVFQYGVFHGYLADTTFETGDTPLPGWTVYLDLNRDGQMNAGEPNAVTGSDGTYLIPNVAPGTYSVREILQSGWNLASSESLITDTVVTAGHVSASTNFDNSGGVGTASGVLFNDLNGKRHSRSW
jgi:hypothetical protein